MSEPTTTREAPSSVEITRNAKGTVQWSIKVYAAVGEEEDAMQVATALDAALKDTYRGELPS
jgi:hypothetical protein